MIFTLPAPPSANRIWRVSRGTVHKSQDYKTWLKDAAWEATRQLGPEKPSEPLCGAISVTIMVHPKDGRVRDIDNYAKPVMDFMEYAGLIEDDKQVERLFILRDERRKEHQVGVTVTEWK